MKQFIKKFIAELKSDTKIKTALWQIANSSIVLLIAYLSELNFTNPLSIGLVAILIAFLNFTTKFINTNYLQ